MRRFGARGGTAWHPRPAVPRHRLEATFLGRCVASFVEMQALDRAMVIASQAFTALIPLLILVSAVLPAASATLVSDSIIRRFGLTGDAARSVEVVFAHSDTGSVGVLSLLLLFYSGISLTRRLQRMYLTAWQLPPLPGVRGPAQRRPGAGRPADRGVAALPRPHARPDAAVRLGARRARHRSRPACCCGPRSPGSSSTGGSPGAGSLPAGLLTGTCSSLYGVASTIYMPRLMETLQRPLRALRRHRRPRGLVALHLLHRGRRHRRRRGVRPLPGAVGPGAYDDAWASRTHETMRPADGGARGSPPPARAQPGRARMRRTGVAAGTAPRSGPPRRRRDWCC